LVRYSVVFVVFTVRINRTGVPPHLLHVVALELSLSTSLSVVPPHSEASLLHGSY
jgi:hypothetical protein